MDTIINPFHLIDNETTPEYRKRIAELLLTQNVVIEDATGDFEWVANVKPSGVEILPRITITFEDNDRSFQALIVPMLAKAIDEGEYRLKPIGAHARAYGAWAAKNPETVKGFGGLGADMMAAAATDQDFQFTARKSIEKVYRDA